MTTDVITENTSAQNATADNLYTGVEDNYLQQSDGGTVKNGSNTILEVTKFGLNDHNHTIIKFGGLSNISSSAVVSAATLYIYQTSTSGSYDVSLRRILQPWVVGNSNWNDYDDPNDWDTAGCLGAGTDRVSAAESDTTIAATTGIYYALDCTSLVQDIVDETISSDEGFHLAMTASGESGEFKILTSSDGTNSQRPELVVVHTIGGGVSIPVIMNSYRQRRAA